MNQPNRTNMFTDFINNNPNMRPGINQRTRTNLINRLSGIPQTIMPRNYNASKSIFIFIW